MSGGDAGRRRMSAPLSTRLKDRDEDLVLFRELHKRDKDRVVSLLQPVSDEFEHNGNYPLYGMVSAKKGHGFGFLGESEKNDYDWLKTPPATPLFPSLDMEAKNAHELVVQRELPLIQPLSRFAGASEEAETKQRSIGAIVGRSKAQNPNPRVPARSVTPSGRSSSLFSDPKKNIKTAPILLSSRTNVSTDLSNKSSKTPSVSKPSTERHSDSDLSGANPSKAMQKSRGFSLFVTSSRIPTYIPGFSDETPANLKTDRSSSSLRGRSVGQSRSMLVAAPQRPEVSDMRVRRQSCSPSIARGRKVAPTGEENTNNMAAQKGGSKMFQTGHGGQILGSRMVDRIMNARKTSIEEKETKLKLRGPINEGSERGRIMSKGSLDMNVKRMEAKRDSVHSHQVGISSGRVSIPTSYAPSSRSNGGS